MNFNFKYVIIGAGSAGSVIANRLSENPKNSVCLIEAGPRDSLPQIKMPLAASSLFKNKKSSEVTFVLTGALRSFQLGISSSRAFVSNTLPLNICAPTSAAFSKRQIDMSLLICFNLMAADRPAGPAPTITTS